MARAPGPTRAFSLRSPGKLREARPGAGKQLPIGRRGGTPTSQLLGSCAGGGVTPATVGTGEDVPIRPSPDPPLYRMPYVCAYLHT